MKLAMLYEIPVAKPRGSDDESDALAETIERMAERVLPAFADPPFRPGGPH